MTKSPSHNLAVLLCALGIMIGIASIAIACNQTKWNSWKQSAGGIADTTNYAYDTLADVCPYEYGECPSALCHNHIFEQHTYETSDSLFYKYEVLLPDYIHSDTLIVMRADELNRLIQSEWIDSNEDIANIVGATTVKYYEWLYRDLALKPM